MFRPRTVLSFISPSGLFFMTIEQIEQTFREWLHIEDTTALRIVLATVIINMCPTDPLWLFIIAPPSSLKTEILNSLRDIEKIYPLSSFTPRTLLSGFGSQDNVKDSLLFKLTGKIVTLKDFTTVISMRQEDKAEILSQLREVYDGYYVRAVGTNKVLVWEGKVGFIGAVTPIIDSHYAIYQALGERFIQYRLPPQDGVEASMMAMSNTGKENEMRSYLRKQIKTFIMELAGKEIDPDVIISRDYRLKLAHLASFCVKARSGVVRDKTSKEILYAPEPEAPPRFAKQLQLLSLGLTLVNKKETFGEDEYAIVFRVAMDSLQKNRIKIVRLLKDSSTMLPTPQIALGAKMPSTTTLRQLEDLYALGLVEKSESPLAWELSAESKKLLLYSIPLKYI